MFFAHALVAFLFISTSSRCAQRPERIIPLSKEKRVVQDAAPVVSVITVCRNAAATLEACVSSVAGQTWPRIEYIVVDGASTDGSAAIFESHVKAISLLVSEPDRGIYDAMNKGLARATGEFVIFMNADDRFATPDAVEKAMAEIAQAPDGDVYYGSLEVRSADRTVRHDPPPPARAAEEMVFGCLPHQATFARRSAFDRTGPFDLRWRRHADYDWWLKVLADPELRVRRIRTLVASFAVGGASSDLAKGQPEAFAIQNDATLFRSREWDRRRIEMFQNAWLDARIELARRDEQDRTSPNGRPRRTRTQPHTIGLLRSWLVRSLPEPAVQAIRSAKQRLVGPRT